uniref:Transcription elongation factor 1 homolog n=1 Tax=Microcebus murinus TaxID=30608 RepID=A0A8C5VDW7_MICMU
MGRRKSKRKPPPKKKMTGTLETQFTCPFCNHEKSCDVKMDRARNTGVISCTVCLEEFQTPITWVRGESAASAPPCALVQGSGCSEEQVPPTHLCGVRSCRAGVQC